MWMYSGRSWLRHLVGFLSPFCIFCFWTGSQYSGNLLGIRYIPCKAASDSLFLPCNNRKLYATDVSNRLRGPEGPQYWQASSSQSSTDHAIYTFFPRAVTSIPQYDFPPKKPVTRQRAYSDESIELISSPSTVVQVFANGNERDRYANTEEHPDWRLLGEEYTRDMEFTSRNYPNEEETTDVPHPAMILDRFSASSPISFSEADDGNVSPTTPTMNRDSWGSPPGYSLRHHARSATTPTSGINFRSHNHGNNEPFQQSFYQQQVLGAWEREREAEEIDRARNVDHDGRRVSGDVRWGLDPDGESEVRGFVDGGQSWETDPYDSESADKSTEGLLFPERWFWCKSTSLIYSFHFSPFFQICYFCLHIFCFQWNLSLASSCLVGASFNRLNCFSIPLSFMPCALKTSSWDIFESYKVLPHYNDFMKDHNTTATQQSHWSFVLMLPVTVWFLVCIS